MEYVLVSVVVEKLGGMMIDQINKKASILLNFRKDFEWLRKKLANIRSYLRETDVQAEHDKAVKDWLLEVAEIAFEAEDILDLCAVQSQGTTNNDISKSSCVCDFSYSQFVFWFKMARRIKDVKDRVRYIMKDSGKELKLVRDLTHTDQPSTCTLLKNVMSRGIPQMEIDSRPVGIYHKVRYVLHLMDDPAAPVIAVVGMGGVGKTFLMKNVFDRAKDKFEKSIWLDISQTYCLEKLQADLASEINLNEVVYGRVSKVQAAKLIHDHLSSKRCLIVLDDVWRATGEDDLISALGIPRGIDSQCKIVVTARNRNVCGNMEARVYDVQPLSEEESWNLFCAYAFPDCQQNQLPHHLEGIARQIEGECGRLPLAVKTVAASLAGERSSREWESKLGQLKAVSHTEDPVMRILKLSYDSLPAYLKPCFVYLSFFPEDEEIEFQYLINLWVAEGCVPEGEDQLDIGWKYIRHLQSLCLVERVGDPYDQENKMFKLHDLLLDLATSISKQGQCVFSTEEAVKNGPILQMSRKYRRILMAKKSMADGDVNVMANGRAYSASRLRTLSFSENRGIQNIPASLLGGARVLRVLDLSGTGISSLPDCVGDLKLLRVLNLKMTKISEVPECVRKNRSLHFLNISWCRNLEQFPEWIGELSCLRHLDIRPSHEKQFDGSMPTGISKLVSLQVLKIDDDNKLSVQQNGFLMLEHFVNLVNLREVRLDIKNWVELKSIEDGILATLVKMRNLTIYNTRGAHGRGNLPPLSEKMLAMKDLEYLYLASFAVPNWILGFSNLTQLELWECHCAKYPALEMMPNLTKLQLYFNNICKALPTGFGKSRGFPSLRSFTISLLYVLEELPEFEDGAMPLLEILKVDECRNLTKGPRGLERLQSLKECCFDNTGVTHMLEKGGGLWNKMKRRNPNVRIRTSSSNAK
ncbi:hypothetical protein SUGI_0365360 [Cryptomeria japonica]|uniref:disease resistance RPP13-like protein 4 n=1 Tax=Cryptomeria japonica TaxID=3369 RepID=UPI002408E320|nr:disease resistance RPP13-like protein 4 [Cryptomeria japonica]GLJ20123.1 hypothetical protein SUGI_0365360 [Cryptomeria japonica]